MEATKSRKERRILESVAAKKFKIKGEAAVQIHTGYQKLLSGDLAGAAAAVGPVISRHPKNVHPWIVLGKVALAQRDKESAVKFFTQASELDPRNAVVQNGLGTAYFLAASPFKCVEHLGNAIELGLIDETNARLYLMTMSQMDRKREAAQALYSVASKSKDNNLVSMTADALMDSDLLDEAVNCYQRILKSEKDKSKYFQASVKKDFLTSRHDDAVKTIREFDGKMPESIVPIAMNVMRSTGMDSEALALLDDYEFTEPGYFQRAVAISANIYRDTDVLDKVLPTLEEAAEISDVEKYNILPLIGNFHFQHRDFEIGAEPYSHRLKDAARDQAPFENSEEENLRSLERIFLLKEQGIGDQLALLPMATKVAQDMGIGEIYFVTDTRLCEMLEGTTLNIRALSTSDYTEGQFSVQPNELAYIGDMVRHAKYLTEQAPNFGGYVCPNPKLVSGMRASYEDMANGRPIIGVSWFSKGFSSGYGRTIPLTELLSHLPEESFVVNLQYGDHKAEIKAAQKKYPKMTFWTDKSVDQMRDMASFSAQIAALDTIVTIDNTTAHTCAAVGHPDTHMLLPKGTERYWYWGTEESSDQWYGALNMHAQTSVRDWSGPLESVKEALKR